MSYWYCLLMMFLVNVWHLKKINGKTKCQMSANWPKNAKQFQICANFCCLSDSLTKLSLTQRLWPMDHHKTSRLCLLKSVDDAPQPFLNITTYHVTKLSDVFHRWFMGMCQYALELYIVYLYLYIYIYVRTYISIYL